MTLSPKYNWIRWIAILPTSIVAYFIAYWMIMLLAVLQEALYNHDWLETLIKSVFAVGMGGYCFVAWGTFMAPSYIKQVSFTLLLLLIFLSGGSVVLLWLNTTTHWQSWLQLAAQIIGGVVGYYQTEQNKKE